MLHRLNPVRLTYIRNQIDRHWRLDSRGYKPLAGRSALDVGCGAGLLTEPLTRLGALVTGVDAADEIISVARDHAQSQELAIRYHAGEVANLESETFDLVTALEVIEHVNDPADFIAQLAARLEQGGVMILSTPNRTLVSKLLLVEGAERVGFIPRGTHDWNKFLRPEELRTLLRAAGLKVIDTTALSFSLAKSFRLGGSDALNYLMTATKE